MGQDVESLEDRIDGSVDQSFYNYLESLRTMSLSALIDEMHSLRKALDEVRSDKTDSPLQEQSREAFAQEQRAPDKLLAVQIEIGRRAKVSNKGKL